MLRIPFAKVGALSFGAALGISAACATAERSMGDTAQSTDLKALSDLDGPPPTPPPERNTGKSEIESAGNCIDQAQETYDRCTSRASETRGFEVAGAVLGAFGDSHNRAADGIAARKARDAEICSFNFNAALEKCRLLADARRFETAERARIAREEMAREEAAAAARREADAAAVQARARPPTLTRAAPSNEERDPSAVYAQAPAKNSAGAESSRLRSMEEILADEEFCERATESTPGSTPEMRRSFCCCLADVERASGRKANENETLSCGERAARAAAAIGRGSNKRRSIKAGHYFVDVALKDESFVFRDSFGKAQLFKAKLYCFFVNEGDEVVFVNGGPDSICASATFLHLPSGKTCDVWCP